MNYVLIGLCVYIVGFILGYIVKSDITKRKSIGTIKVAWDPEEGPYLFLDLDRDISLITKDEYAIVKIETQMDSSHE